MVLSFSTGFSDTFPEAVKKCKMLRSSKFAFSGSESSAQTKAESVKNKLLKYRRTIDDKQANEDLPSFEQMNDISTVETELTKTYDGIGKSCLRLNYIFLHF